MKRSEIQRLFSSLYILNGPVFSRQKCWHEKCESALPEVAFLHLIILFSFMGAPCSAARKAIFCPNAEREEIFCCNHRAIAHAQSRVERVGSLTGIACFQPDKRPEYPVSDFSPPLADHGGKSECFITLANTQRSE